MKWISEFLRSIVLKDGRVIDSLIQAFSKAETAKVIAIVLDEEGRPPESVFDFVQGITALARSKPHQDARLELEGNAKILLERAV
jgi:hypothetical protein